MFGLGMQEILVILCVGFLIFGAAKLPRVGKSMGEAVKNFKSAVKEGEIDSEVKQEAKNEKA